MKKAISPIPEAVPSLTPYLIVRGAARAIEFYREAFGARELYRGQVPGGEQVMHCEMLVGDSRFFLKDEVPEWGATAPRGWSVTHYLYVSNCDEVYARAIAAGATAVSPLGDSFWGDRCGMVRDPFGHVWCIASRFEDPAPGEISERGKRYFEAVAGKALVKKESD